MNLNLGTNGNRAKAAKAKTVKPSDDRSEAQKFFQAYGPQGAVLYSQGLTFEQAGIRHMAILTEENDRLREENENLRRGLNQ